MDLDQHNWYVVKTRYKSEKMVRRMLLAKGVEAYLPLISRTRKYTRKIKKYQIPLINCYVFVRIPLNKMVRVLETPNVLDFVRTGMSLSIVPEYEIESLRKVTGELENAAVGDIEFITGDQVEIEVGQMAGLKGILETRLNNHEFVLQLESIGYQLRIVVDRKVLRKIPERLAG